MPYTPVDKKYLQQEPVKYNRVAVYNVVSFTNNTKLATIRDVMTGVQVTVVLDKDVVQGQDYQIGVEFATTTVSSTKYSKADVIQPANFGSTFMAFGF